MTSKTLNMEGPFSFTPEEIDKQITRTSAGNYALGYLENNTFIVLYVGRSDSNVCTRLQSHVGNHPQCDQFKYSYASSAKAAYEKECQNYHDFTPPENKIHPDQPSNNSRRWACPEGCQ
ncbi:hypothetical protein RJE46_12135 [Cedecea neteri]|uniref:hypothetical protein n=1 Tax=Cedecea neteri TaxID=158822 RepID=UPI0028934BCC|nr:hypothetical protein [Cedecea neteri]WNJ81933.1 hypothetical protein RJE46_12135 [Cedecea neteri]